MRQLLFFFVLLSLCYSCKRAQNVVNKDNENGTVNENDIVHFQFVFPDTVQIGKNYNGKIKYQGILDTITTEFKFVSNAASRYINYAYTISNDTNNFSSRIKTVKLDTIGALNNHTILLSDFKFNKMGTYYIDGFIEDQVFIPTSQKDKDGEHLSRAITNTTRATHKIVVKE